MLEVFTVLTKNHFKQILKVLILFSLQKDDNFPGIIETCWLLNFTFNAK